MNNTSKNLTIREFAEIIGEDYLTATAVVKLMVKTGAAKEIGKRSVEGQRGKPSIVFEIPQDFDLSFWPDDETVAIETAAPTPEVPESLNIPEVKSPELVS